MMTCARSCASSTSRIVVIKVSPTRIPFAFQYTTQHIITLSPRLPPFQEDRQNQRHNSRDAQQEQDTFNALEGRCALDSRRTHALSSSRVEEPGTHVSSYGSKDRLAQCRDAEIGKQVAPEPVAYEEKLVERHPENDRASNGKCSAKQKPWHHHDPKPPPAYRQP